MKNIKAKGREGNTNQEVNILCLGRTEQKVTSYISLWLHNVKNGKVGCQSNRKSLTGPRVEIESKIVLFGRRNLKTHKNEKFAEIQWQIST